MADVHLIHGDLERLIEESLTATGHVTIDTEQTRIDVPALRAVVRAVARRHGRTYRTYARDGRFHAIFSDWPRDEREERIDRERMRATMEAMSRGPDW